MDEEKGEDHPQGRKDADLGQDSEPAQQQHQKAADRRQRSKDFRRPDLAGGLPTRDLAGTVQEQQIGDPQIHREGHDRPAETDGQDGEGGKEERAEKQRENGAGRGRKQGQKPDEGPGKGDDQQEGDPDRRQDDRRSHVVAGGVLVVQRGPVGPRGRQGETDAAGLNLAVELLPERLDERGNGSGIGRVRRRTLQFRHDEQMFPVPGEQFPPVELGVPARQELGHPGQDRVSQTEGITGDEVGLPDPFEPLHDLEIFRQRPAHLGRREERRDLRLQLRSVVQQGQVTDDMGHQFRKERLHLLHADLPEKTALPEPGLDQVGPGR
ncbi:MAG: hypothetical protein NT047_09650 [Deltaproteobacteria bacterium]|nr:hypothetical protein [Deltaproteobacteria bacterium]